MTVHVTPDVAPLAEYQNGICMAGAGGARPDLPITPDAMEARAREVLDAEAFGYVAGGAGSEDTMRANREAFRRWRIVPRMLVDVQHRDLSVDMLGARLPAPVLLAPIGVQGILRPDDARRAIDHGADAIVVSNHGGRQVDGAIAALDALPDVVEAVGGIVPVLFDSGIRTGADAFKAIALGARAVLLGRPYAWGLAVGGQRGIEHVLRSFLAELDLTLALSGYASVADVDRDALRRI